MTKAPTTREILAQAKAAGLEVVRSGTLNGAPAYRLGRSAALLTIADIARRLGYAV